MKKLIKIILYILFFSFSLIVFFPKENLYFLLEKSLKKKEIIISQESIDDKMLYLEISVGHIIYKNKPYAKFESSDIMSGFIFSKITIHNISFFNKDEKKHENLIKSLNINHSILNPLNLQIDAKGKIGEMSGIVSLQDKKIILNLNPSRLVKNHFSYLLKNWKLVKGKYYYEYQF